MKRECVYFIGGEEGPIKVGYSNQTPPVRRLSELQTGSPVPLRIFGTLDGPIQLEQDCHRILSRSRSHGEWYDRGPALDLLLDLSVVEDFNYEKDDWRLTAYGCDNF